MLKLGGHEVAEDTERINFFLLTPTTPQLTQHHSSQPPSPPSDVSSYQCTQLHMQCSKYHTRTV